MKPVDDSYSLVGTFPVIFLFILFSHVPDSGRVISFIFSLSYLHVPDSGRAISFKPDDDSTFLVGTDEGMVYLCTTQYSSRYLNTYPVSSILIRIGGKISTGRPTTRLCTTSSGTPSSQTSSSPVLQVIFLILSFSWRYFQ